MVSCGITSDGLLWIQSCRYYLGGIHIIFDALVTAYIEPAFVEFFDLIIIDLVINIDGKVKSQALNIWDN